MYKVLLSNKRIKRKLRIRNKISGTAARPRLTVFRSVKYTYAQLIDDVAGKTLVSVFDMVKSAHTKGKAKSDVAFDLGKALAERALEKGIKSAVFDRNGYLYHGRVKRIADGVREGGLHV